MYDRHPRHYLSAALLCALCLTVSSPAKAGFQWVAPSDSAAAPPMILQQQAPAAVSAPEIVSPVVITGGSSGNVLPAPAAASAPAPLVTETKAPAPADNAVVMGFAKSVPLSVALRQILPSGYAFSIDPDVDMGTLVSFQGGHAWRDTLRDALAPVGLVMHEQGQMITVASAGHNVLPTMPATQVAIPSSNFQSGLEPKTLTVPPTAIPPSNSVIVPVDSSMVTPSATSVNPSSVSESWTAERGEHLRRVLEDWSRRANVEFDWMSEYDYPLEASVSFTGNFESAVRGLLTGFEGAHPQPVAELHSNSNLGQMVLVITARGNTNSD